MLIFGLYYRQSICTQSPTVSLIHYWNKMSLLVLLSYSSIQSKSWVGGICLILLVQMPLLQTVCLSVIKTPFFEFHYIWWGERAWAKRNLYYILVQIKFTILLFFCIAWWLRSSSAHLVIDNYIFSQQCNVIKSRPSSPSRSNFLHTTLTRCCTQSPHTEDPLCEGEAVWKSEEKGEEQICSSSLLSLAEQAPVWQDIILGLNDTKVHFTLGIVSSSAHFSTSATCYFIFPCKATHAPHKKHLMSLCLPKQDSQDRNIKLKLQQQQQKKEKNEWQKSNDCNEKSFKINDFL